MSLCAQGKRAGACNSRLAAGTCGPRSRPAVTRPLLASPLAGDPSSRTPYGGALKYGSLSGASCVASAALASMPETAPPNGADPSSWAPLNGMTAVIVGAGPAGCTLAMYLAKAGWLVRVYERRPEPGPAGTSRQRSWVLAMYPRGIRPVNAVASVPLLEERSYKGLVILGGTPESKPTVLERTGVLMDRTLLANALLDAARSGYASRVTFTFNATLADVRLPAKRAVFDVSSPPAPAAPHAAAAERELVGAAAEAAAAQRGGGSSSGSRKAGSGGGSSSSSDSGSNGSSSSGSQLEVPYDLVVGADGANSAVRAVLAAAFPGQFDTQVLSAGGSCYKAVYGLPPLPETAAWDPDHGVAPGRRRRGQYFFVLGGGKGGFVSMCRDIDGTYCGYLAAGPADWEALRSLEDYLAALPRIAPRLPAPWLPLLADKLAEAPLSSFPTMRSLSRFWAPGGAVLLGDAAHTVTPALGQGLNSALQDAELLAGQLAGAQSPEALDGAVRRFSEARAPEVRALQELELLQSASLAPLSWSTPGGLLPLLWRKWLIFHYSGVALLGTVAQTAQAERAAKARQEAVEAGEDRSGEADPGEVDGRFVRSPPMYELLRGHMEYGTMLTRLYGMAALGSGMTVGLLYGIGSAVRAGLEAAAAVLAA